tara:strand:+ start:5840 stop:6568 length:729 start_codon:yes stop_codon:yes gene_type:complete
MVSLDVLQDSNISQSQKLVLSLIIQLDNDMGCYATNDYMAGFLGISKRQVQKHIHNLILSKYLPEPIYRIQKLGNREQTLRVFRGVSKVTSQEQKGQLGVSKASPKGIEERLILFTDDVEKVIKSTKVLSQFEKDEMKKFISWWTEKTRNNKMFRQELQSTWETKKRWSTWMSGKIEKNGKPKKNGFIDITKFPTETTGMPRAYCDECGNLETYKDIWEIKSGSRCHGALLLPTKPSIKIAV